MNVEPAVAGRPKVESARVTLTLEARAPAVGDTAMLAKPTDVAVGPNGEFVVLDAGGQRVMVFGADGRPLRTVGGPGAGPGEFSPGISTVVAGSAGRFLVPDPGLRRIQVFEPDGSLAAAMAMPFAGLPVAWLALPNNEVLQASRVLSTVPGERRGVFEPQIAVRKITATGAPAIGVVETGGRPARELMAPLAVAAFLPGGGMVVGPGAGYELTCLSPRLDVVWRVRRDVPAIPLGASDRERILSGMTQSLPEGARAEARQALLSQLGFAPDYPSVTQIIASPEGEVWVQRPRLASELGPGEPFTLDSPGGRVWDVFGPSGEYVMEATLPAAFQLRSVRGNRLYGVDANEDGEPFVARFRLDTAPPP